MEPKKEHEGLNSVTHKHTHHIAAFRGNTQRRKTDTEPKVTFSFQLCTHNTEDREEEERSLQERKMASIPCALIVLLICLSQDHMGELQGINVTMTTTSTTSGTPAVNLPLKPTILLVH